MLHLPLKIKLLLPLLVFVVGFLVFGVSTQKAQEQLVIGGPLFEDILLRNQVVADTAPPPLNLLEAYFNANQLYLEDDQTVIAGLTKRGFALHEKYDKTLAIYRKKLAQGTPERALLEESAKAAQKFFRMAEAYYYPCIKDRDVASGRTLLRGPLLMYFQQNQVPVSKLLVLSQKENDAALKAAKQQTADIVRNQWLLLIVIGSLSVGLGLFFSSGVIRQVSRIAWVLEKMAVGDLTHRV